MRPTWRWGANLCRPPTAKREHGEAAPLRPAGRRRRHRAGAPRGRHSAARRRRPTAGRRRRRRRRAAARRRGPRTQQEESHPYDRRKRNPEAERSRFVAAARGWREAGLHQDRDAGPVMEGDREYLGLHQASVGGSGQSGDAGRQVAVPRLRVSDTARSRCRLLGGGHTEHTRPRSGGAPRPGPSSSAVRFVALSAKRLRAGPACGLHRRQGLPGRRVGDRHAGPQARAGTRATETAVSTQDWSRAAADGPGRCCSSGAPGLRRAITDVFGSLGVVQRCQVHKLLSAICPNGCTRRSARRCGMPGTSSQRTARRGC